MSIPPDKSHHPFKPWEGFPEQGINKDQIIKSLAWGIGAITVGVLIGENFETIFELLKEGVILLLEFCEEILDLFFEKVLKLGPTVAPMLTAYTGFVIALVLLYFLVRKCIKLYHQVTAVLTVWKQAYINAFDIWWNDWRGIAMRWWDAQTMMNKIIAGTAFVLIGIPLALIISVFLGSVVASFF